MVKILCNVACIVLALTPVIGARAQAPDQDVAAGSEALDAGPDIRDYVSPALEAGEQRFMRAYMNSLPRKFKERIAGQAVNSVSVAIVDGGTGTIHYNRPEEAGSYEIVRAAALPGDEHPLVHNATRNPGLFGGSGPYRRIYTVPLPASPTPPSDASWYEQEGVVSATCKAGNFAHGDRGYSYMGGWSPTWDSAGTPAVIDAGLVYNYQASKKSIDDYSVFMNLGNGIGIISKGNAEQLDGDPLYPQPTHIGCYSPGMTRLNFSVLPAHQLPSRAPECWDVKDNEGNFTGFPIAACNTYALMLSVASEHFLGFEGGHTSYIVWVSPNVTDGGWAHLDKYTAPYWNGKKNVAGWVANVTCGGCIFKWMTSIAQSKGNTLTDGSYFGAVWYKREISGYALGEPFLAGSGELKTITAQITDCSEYPLWRPPYSTNYQADCKNSPSGLTGIAKTVEVKDYVPGGEWDIIAAKY